MDVQSQIDFIGENIPKNGSISKIVCLSIVISNIAHWSCNSKENDNFSRFFKLPRGREKSNSFQWCREKHRKEYLRSEWGN